LTRQRGCFGRHIVQRRRGWPYVASLGDVALLASHCRVRWGTWWLRGKADTLSLHQDGGGGDGGGRTAMSSSCRVRMVVMVDATNE
jgi:hypothetical protein